MEKYEKLISKQYLMKKQLVQIESKNKQTTGGTRTGPAGSMRSDLNPDTEPEEPMITSFRKRSRLQGTQRIFTNQITHSWLCRSKHHIHGEL